MTNWKSELKNKPRKLETTKLFCSSEWINKLWCIHTVNEISSYDKTRRQCSYVLPSGRSQPKNKSYGSVILTI